jgi:hypothetical protein
LPATIQSAPFRLCHGGDDRDARDELFDGDDRLLASAISDLTTVAQREGFQL